MRVYAQLTQEQRYHIHAFLKAGYTQSAIAKDMTHKSTVSRARKRHHGLRGCRPKQAQEKAVLQRHEKSKTRIASAPWNLVDAPIKQDWSPDQVSSRLFKEQGISVSHASIYLHIYQDKQQGGHLHDHLRCQKKRRKRYGGRDRRERIPSRISMDKGSWIINEQSRVGDWEGRTLIGKGRRGVVVPLVERKTHYAMLAESKSRQAGSVI